jgi:hypothetical protein
MDVLVRRVIIIALIALTGCSQDPPDAGMTPGADTADAHIQPYAGNPHYLAWGETPIFPLGATGYHSWTPISRPGTMDFISQLDRLADVIDAVDSPHVRGFVRAVPYDPMNHLHDGPVDRVLQPWVRRDDGRYDLEKFAPEWEERLEEFLDAALRREIIVSLELWDDWSITRGPGGQYDPGAGAAWNGHPFNPNNNVNYGPEVMPGSTAVCSAPFYSTVPSRDYIEPVLDLQQRYVDRVLDIVSDYPNVLINIANESRAHVDWSRFWAEYAGNRLPERFMVGEMPSTNRDNDRGQCDSALSPEALATDSLYDYVDVAQAVSGHSFNSFRDQALRGGARINHYRKRMAENGSPKPIVVSKDYGRTSEGGNQVLWSRFAGGGSAARFHRLGEDHGREVIDFQHAAIERLGQFLAEIPFWRLHPASELVVELPSSMGANALADEDRRMVIQLIGEANDGALTLELPPDTWNVTWWNPATGEPIGRFERRIETTGLQLKIPGDLNHGILHVQPTDG